MDSVDYDLPLTRSQTLILTGQQLQPDDPLYNMVLAFRIRGEIDPKLFQRAFSALIDRCDALRTVIVGAGGQGAEPRQHVLSEFKYELELIDIAEETDPESVFEDWASRRSQRQLERSECLFDSALIKLGEDDWVWYLNQHHLLTDAWSMQVLYHKMWELYQLGQAGSMDEAAALPAFRDYVIRQTTQGESVALEKARAFWQEQLAQPLIPSRFYRAVPSARAGRTCRLHCRLGAERAGRLLSLIQRPEFRAFSQDLSLMQVFATVLIAYLHRMCGHHAISLGTPSHSRTSPDLKGTAGLLIEIFPLQVSLGDEESFQSLYTRVAKSNQQLLMHALPGSADFEHNRAFDVLLNYIPSSFGSFAGLPVTSDWIHPGYGDRNHLLRLQVHNFDEAEDFTLHFDVNEEVFVGAEREWVIEHFLILLDQMLEDPTQNIAAPALVSAEKVPPYQRAVSEWETEPTINSTILDCLQEQSEATPEQVALVCQGETLSYQELAQRSGQLADIIAALGIVPGDVVAVCMPRNNVTVVAILAVLKANAVLLPIDPAYPQQRIQFILSDARTRLVLTQGDMAQTPEDGEFRVLNLAAQWPAASTDDYSRHTPALDDTAYMIYTSGSTGTPKGVVVSHRSLSNYIQWARDYYLQGEALDFALFSSLSFDLTLTSLLVPLLSGGRLLIYPEPEDPSEILIRTIVEDNQAEVIKLTPAHLSLIQAMDLSRSRIRKLIVGGEDFKTDIAQTLSHQFGDQIELYNEYGPTEGTVACTVHRFDVSRDLTGSVPIGKPISNAWIYILDEHMHPVPQGVTGELYIGGAGVASGYLNREALTRERFLPDCFHSGGMMYKTGDLARWNEDAVIEYLGRNDHQVKIRGVRIETSEVEAALLALDPINDVVVDVGKIGGDGSEGDIRYCAHCGLAGNHPSAQLDGEHICRICRIYERHEPQAHAYFRTLADLEALIAQIRAQARGEQDCIMLLSGGKDSSYALCRLVDMGLTPLVFTLDNGFISDGAKANIRRLVDRLGLELIVAETPAMNEIFVDSLKRHSNVCNGCFKTIYTLSMNAARERGIRYICTGLSRGQIFESRVAHLFQQGIFDAAQIDEQIIEARKAYHRTDDVIARSLEVEIFKDDAVFSEVQYLDFYRYSDVTLAEVMEYLDTRAPWIRPSDTGRSTNCLINDAGISVHKQERGYHNYALPYSWDVRLGHKERDAALDELNDDLDADKVNRILHEVGYTPGNRKLNRPQDNYLAAYYVASENVSEQELRDELRRSLPPEFIPRFFIALNELPLTDNGKLDRQALPRPEPGRPDTGADYIPPANETETLLAQIWSHVLGMEGVGVEDNFFELGGDSITNIQIVAAARESGIEITPQQIFDFPTIRGLAQVAGSVQELLAEQGSVQGESPLLPSQLRYFSEHAEIDQGFSQTVLLECEDTLDPDWLQQSLAQVLSHHDALRSRFERQESEWKQFLLAPGEVEIAIDYVESAAADRNSCQAEIELDAPSLYATLNPCHGRLVAVRYTNATALGTSFLLIAIHHLVMDGVSWWVLLSDLEMAYRQLAEGKPPKLPAKTSSLPHWGKAISAYAESMRERKCHEYWLQNIHARCGLLPAATQADQIDAGAVDSLVISLSERETAQLIQEVPGAYSVQVPEVLLTAIARCLLPWTKNTQLRIDVEGHGREDPVGGYNLVRTLGWFTSIYPISLERSSGGVKGADLKQVKDQLRSVPLRGAEYGMLRYLSGDDDIVAQLNRQPRADILFNYMGQWEKNLSRSSRFSFARPIEVFRQEPDPKRHPLEINAMVFDGELQVCWTYSRGLLGQAVIEQLAGRFLEELRELIEYCVTTEDNSFTPSDFPAAGLDQQNLDDLLAEFGE